jgi:hypothetical protein
MPELDRPRGVTGNPAQADQRSDTVNLTPDQLDRIGQFSDHWSFLWDKRRLLWIAAEDCPDGEQVEEADLDVLLARLPVIPLECL